MLRDALLLLALFEGLPACAWVFQTTAPPPARRKGGHPAFRVVDHRHSSVFSSSEIVDVEFEHLSPENSTSNVSSQGKVFNTLGEETTTSLLDLSIAADPEFTDSRIPFLDYGVGGANAKGGGTNFIDVKIAFMAELDGVQYGIGVPFDSAVAVTMQKSGSVQYISPDTDDNEELLEIMAAQLHEHVGTDLKLQKTPRVLTIVGPLDNYTKNWREKLLPDPVGAEDLMDTSDNTLDFFHQFMRQELGDEEYEKTMNEEDDDDDDLPSELLDLFDIPGFSESNDDSEATMKEFMESILSPEKDYESAKESLGLNNLDHEGVALKLISYVFGEGKSYSLVKLLRPYILVGRFVPDENDPRFELLDTEEEKIVLPRLEEVCQADLERAGLANLTN